MPVDSFYKVFLKLFEEGIFNDINLNQYIDLPGQFQKALIISQAIQEQDITILREVLKNIFNELSPKQSFIIPGSWIPFIGDGHGVVYEIVKQTDERLTFRIYNSGDGIAKHAHYIQDGRIFHAPMREMTDIELNTLLNPNLLTILCELPDKKEGSIAQYYEDIQPDDVYLSLFSLLNGNLQHNTIEASKLISPQLSGTCSLHAILAYLSHLFSDPNDFYRMELKLQLKILQDHTLNLSLEELALDQDKKQILVKALPLLSQKIVHYYEQSVLTQKEFEEISSYISQVHARVTKAGNSEKKLSLREPIDPISYASAKTSPINWPMKVYSPPGTINPGMPITQSYHTINIEQIVIDRDAIAASLEKVNNILSIAMDNGQYTQVEQVISHVIGKLAFSEKAGIDITQIVENLSLEDTLNISHQLIKMAKSFFFASIQTRSKNKLEDYYLESALLLTQIKILSIEESLFNRFCELQGLQHDHVLISPSVNKLIRGKNPHFNLMDPKLEDEFQDLVSYYEKNNLQSDSKSSFFAPSGRNAYFPLDYSVYYDKKEEHPTLLYWDYLDSREFANQYFQIHKVPFNRDLIKSRIKACFDKESDKLFPSIFLEASEIALLTELQTKSQLLSKNINTIPTFWFLSSDDNSSQATIFLNSNNINTLSWKFFADFHSITARNPIETSRKEMDELFYSMYANTDVTSIEEEKDKIYCDAITHYHTSQRFRELNELYRGHENTIFNILGYFLNDVSLLEYPNMPTVYELLFYKPPLLLKELMASKEGCLDIINYFTQFSSQILKYARRTGSKELFLFAIQDQLRFAKYVKYIQKHTNYLDRNRVISLIDIPPLLEEFRVKFMQSKEDEGLISLLHLHYLYLRDNYTPKNLQAIYTHFIRFKNLSNLENTAKKILDLDALMEKAHSHMQDLWITNRARAFSIVSSISKEVGVDMDEINPESIFPLITNQANTHEINLATAEMTIDDNNVVKIPHDMFLLFSLFIPNLSDATITKSPTERLYKIITKDGITYEILMRDKLDDMILKRDGLILAFDKTQLPHWLQSFMPYQDPETGDLYIAAAPPDKNQGKMLYKLEANADATSYIKLLKLAEANQEYVDIRDSSNSGLIFLSKFENPEFIALWKDQSNELITSIEFPRYNLSFSLRNNHLYSTKYSGYFLSRTQTIADLESYSHYLVLENSQGEILVLFPNKIFDQSKSSLDTKYTFRDDNHAEIAIKLDPNTLLFPLQQLSSTQRAFLIKIYLSQHSYDKADAILKTFASSTKAFSQEEVDSLLAIFSEGNYALGGHDPKALSCRLKALSTVMNNIMDYGTSHQLKVPFILDKTKVEQLDLINKEYIAAYHKYLQVRHLMGKFALSEESELSILHFFLPHAYSSMEMPLLKRLKSIDEGRFAKTVSLLELQKASNIFVREGAPYSRHKVEKIIRSPEFGFIPLSDEKSHISLLRPIWDQALFLSLYQQIKSGKIPKEDRIALQPLLQFSTFFKTKNNLYPQQILYALSIAPDKFPSIGKDDLSFLRYDHLCSITEDILSALTVKDLSIPSQFISNIPTLSQFFSNLLNPSYFKSLYYDAADKIEDILPENEKFHFHPSLPKPGLDDRCIPISLPEILFTTKENLLPEDLFTPLISSVTKTPFSDAIKIPSSKHIITEEIRSLTHAIDSYLSDSSPPFFDIVDIDRLTKHQITLKDTLETLDNDLFNMELDILQLANKAPENAVDFHKRVLEHIGFVDTPIDLAELKLLFLSRSYVDFKNRNPALTDADCDLLITKLSQYLITSIEKNKITALLSNISQLHRFSKHSIEAKSLIQQIHTLGTSTRQYDYLAHPEYLVFEEAMGINLYKEQIENLDKLSIDRGKINNSQAIGAVLEMMVGSGKTYVLAPLLAKMTADGDKIPLLIIPESLFPSMSKDLATSLGSAFSQAVQSFHFSRESNLEVDDLKWIHYRLLQAREDKSLVMMTSSSIQSFYLMYIESLVQFETDNTESSYEKTQLFRDILTLLKKKGIAYFDEIDTILHPLKEHQFVLKTNPPDADITRQISNIYQTLLEIPYTNKILLDGGSSFSTNLYEEIVPDIVESILSGRASTNSHFNTFIHQVDKKFLSTFLHNANSRFAYRYLATLPADIRNELSLYKELIHSILKLTLNKHSNEHFGLSKKETTLKIAIPYHGSNTPSEGSRFGTIYETINYTYQHYLKEKIQKNQIEEVLKFIQSALIRAFKNDPNVDLQELPESQFFSQITGNKLSIDTLFRLDKHLDLIVQVINEDPKLIICFVTQYILPTMQAHSKHIKTGPQLYGSLFHKASGFTGTLWNSDTFPDIFHMIPSERASSKILHALWSKSLNKVSKVSQKVSLDDRIRQLLYGKSQAIIDTGAYFRGIDNKEVAEAIIRTSSKKACIFYDENDSLKVLIKVNGHFEEKEYKKGMIAEEDAITFYDQKHTTGSDIPQSVLADGIITIGEHITIRDLIQSAGRMRKLTDNQSVSFAVTDEIKQLIIDTLKANFNLDAIESISFKEILLFAISNQAVEKANHNFRAFKAKVHMEFEKRLMRIISDKTLSQKDLAQVLSTAKDWLILDDKSAPFEQFGQYNIILDSKNALQTYIERFLEKSIIKKCMNHSIIKKAFGSRFKTKLLELIDYYHSRISESIMLVDSSYESEVAVQKEVEKEVEKETATVSKASTCKGIEPLKEKIFFKPITKYSPNSHQSYALELIKKFLPKKIFENFTNTFPILNLKDLIPGDIFDPKIDIVYNAIPNGIDPFSGDMRNAYHALIIQDGSNNLSLLMLDEFTANHFKVESSENIVKSYFSDMKSPVKVALYHMQLDGCSKKEDSLEYRIDADSLLENPEFIWLKSQMKFFNGAVHYSKKELMALRQWFREQGPEKMRAFFLEKVLAYKDHSQKKFSTSNLFRLFEELIV